MTNLAPITPDAPEWFAQMAAFPLPPCDAEALQHQLCDEFDIEIPIITWNERRFVRISVQGYNTPADADALPNALGALLPRA